MYTNLAAIQTDLKQRKITLSSLVENYLNTIEANNHLNAFLEVFADESRTIAKQLDEKISAGKAGKLAGLVIGLKDNICYKNHACSASSKILEGFVSMYHSTVVERLLAEDAIIIGRLNCDEFAMGSSNENSAYGPVLNPLDTSRVTGGSSGGSVAAVAANLCLAALGTDTGGSVRQPCSFTGLVGLKPTYGRISRYGIIAYASSFDQVGTITHTVEDAALILEVISGKDEFDSTASSTLVPEYSKQLQFNKKVKIAYFKECIESTGLNPEIRKRTEAILQQLKNLGHTVEEVTFPYLDYLVPAYYVLTTAEASSNLSRYDGIHYGYRSKQAFDLESTYKKSRSEGFGKEVKRRIMLGTFVLSAGYYDAYYSKAQKVRRILKNKVDEILNQYDFIVLPSTPDSAFKFGENSQDPIKMYLEDIFTVLANLSGIPSISLPLGQKQNQLPFGIQVLAKEFDESNLLAFSTYLVNNS
ncbi:MAG: Asp-tRNA(Asn)/Glu-tRNA(Gln) amidotransferase subunit GatA [Bacteroidetes bacterium]|nr:Asp-tRNA(Asn)/Glu-tRNA(Gln) amidotransferase subunit GatA [Bacteroidota bacterium]MBK9672341.1 Asp-tRNA(Asn)/Glu-tRNA(Gln) amidotransferase subunit GatA [Bacteroidota bacterium]MBK9799963.1 Asp-tRNA(Asn)/Glu-tRNA(Gln) amidotransferase subunit GatA [Bacteroidota bacterium]MBP6413897.1 Asp-tRNA(Asn)/Glu-tRNA(Gln) amidotransferase subunit GatA [Bacteroidia bacterium]